MTVPLTGARGANPPPGTCEEVDDRGPPVSGAQGVLRVFGPVRRTVPAGIGPAQTERTTFSRFILDEEAGT